MVKSGAVTDLNENSDLSHTDILLTNEGFQNLLKRKLIEKRAENRSQTKENKTENFINLKAKPLRVLKTVELSLEKSQKVYKPIPLNKSTPVTTGDDSPKMSHNADQTNIFVNYLLFRLHLNQCLKFLENDKSEENNKLLSGVIQANFANLVTQMEKSIDGAFATEEKVRVLEIQRELIKGMIEFSLAKKSFKK